jgi:uncharacterized membrane protein YfhO
MVKGGDGYPFAGIQASILARNPRLTSLLRDQKHRHVVPATDYKLTNNTTSFTITAPSEGVIVLTEAYWDKNFRVTVNGKPAHYFRVNHAFKGVAIEQPGSYIVTFSYWPQYFTLSLWVSGAGLFLLFIWIGYLWQAGSKKREVFVNKPLT